MKSLILSAILVLSLTSKSYPNDKPDIYMRFYGNADTCNLLEKSKFEAYRLIASGQAEILTFGQDPEKYDAYFAKSLETLTKFPTISINKELFTKDVIDQLIEDAIYVWEREGDNLINYPVDLVLNTCLKRK